MGVNGSTLAPGVLELIGGTVPFFEKKIWLQEDEKKMVILDLDCHALTSKMLLNQLAENSIVHSCKKKSFANEKIH